MSKFYTSKDLSEIMEVSPKTILNWEERRVLPVATRFGHQGRLRWLKTKLDPWLIRKGMLPKVKAEEN